jgi:hypothetical protein
MDTPIDKRTTKSLIDGSTYHLVGLNAWVSLSWRDVFDETNPVRVLLLVLFSLIGYVG